MSDDLVKWDWEKHILPIYEQLKLRSGTIHHRISNKKPKQKNIDDIFIVFEAEPIKFIDPVKGEINSENPKLWFEQLYSEGNISLESIKDLENASYEFPPGKVWGSFSDSIDLMILSLDFGELNYDQIDLKMKCSLTNRDNLFEGDFKSHSENSLSIETNLKIESLIYLDYQNSSKSLEKRSKYLDSSIYALGKIEPIDIGWKEKGMKSFKVLLKK